jgi:hypothetical protein
MSLAGKGFHNFGIIDELRHQWEEYGYTVLFVSICKSIIFMLRKVWCPTCFRYRTPKSAQ